MCSVNPICSRPRTPSVGLPRFQANAAHAGGSFPQRCSMNRFKDITGQKFGRLTALRVAPEKTSKQFDWECACECGRHKIIKGSNLRRGLTKSCGCILSEVTTKRNLTHGGSHTPEYRTWAQMRRRCLDPNDSCFKKYGAVGITVCERWGSFPLFLQDMGLKPTPRHTIDRYPNQRGNYEPGNCRWATYKEQAQNRSSNAMLDFGGRRQTMGQWATETGIKIGTLWARIEAGWSVEDSLLTPTRKFHWRANDKG